MKIAYNDYELSSVTKLLYVEPLRHGCSKWIIHIYTRRRYLLLLPILRTRFSTRIMIVDDNLELAQALKSGLELEGFEVTVYQDPLEAITGFRPSRYDLVLLDVSMPAVSGFEVYRRLKRTDSNVRVCFLTAFNIYDREFSRLFPDMKVERFLKKPVTIRAITEQIEQMPLGSRR